MLKQYESWGEYLHAASDPKCKSVRHATASTYDWYGDMSYTQALELANNGDDSYVARAEKVLETLQDLNGGVDIIQWQPSIAGAYPCVAEYLSGSPTPMRRQAPTGEVSPIRILVGSSCSGGISSKQMEKRGTYILALLLRLQAIRPVELALVSEMDGTADGNYIQVIPIDSKPLSLAHAAYALCNVGFTRRVQYSTGIAFGGSDGSSWPRKHKNASDVVGHADYLTWLKEHIGMQPDDVFVDSAHLQDPLITEPIKWINEQIQRYNKVGEE